MYADGQTIGIAYWDASNTRLKYALSSDAGSTWSIAVPDEQGNVGMQSAIASDSGTVIIAYLERITDSEYNLKAARSSDSGITWPKSEIRTIAGSGSVIRDRIPIVMNGTNAYLIYNKQKTTGWNTRCAVSDDRGLTWDSSKDRVIEEDRASSVSIDAASNGYVTVAYRIGSNTNKCAVSLDFGASWNVSQLILPPKIAGSGWSANISGNEIVAVNPSGPSFAYSSDKGAAWTRESMLSNFGSTYGYSMVSRSGSSVYILDTWDNKIIVMHSLDLGITWY